MSEDFEPSPILPIGDKRYLCVEYPGYVKRTNRALQTLGGEKALAEALAQETTVKLKFRPGEPFAHPIQGHILPNSKLLVKVTRRVKRDKLTGEIIEEEEGSWKTEIKGLVTKSLRFRALADFQYIVPKDDKIRQLRQALAQGDVEHILNYRVATDDENIEDLRSIPPPSFTPLEGPLNYGYRQSAPVLRVRVRQPDGSFQIKLLNRSRTTGFEVTAIRFDEENIPSKSWHMLPPLERKKESEVHRIISRFFKERPVWTRNALRNKLPSDMHPMIKTALVRIAYTFMDGPWRDCWVAYGKDPRKEPEYYKYQVTEIRKYFAPLSKDLKGKKLRKGRTYETEPMRKPYKDQPEVVGPQEMHIFDGKNVSTISNFYQLVDVVDPDLQELIHNPEYRKPVATKINGYYYQCTWDRIRKVMRAKHASLVDKGEPLAYPNADDGLLEEITKEKEKAKEAEDDERGEDEAEGEGEDTTMAEASDAVQKAVDAMSSPDKGKRLKDVVDDYMNELTTSNNNEEEDLEDDIEALEEYDEDEFNYATRGEAEVAEEEGDNTSIKAEAEPEDNDETTTPIKLEQTEKTDEDTVMEDADTSN